MSNHADWMSSVSQILGPMHLNMIPIPGSHDAGSYGGLNSRSHTQGLDVTGQLNAGIRYFDFRLRIDNGEFFSHHGSDESRDNPYLHAPWDESHEKKRNSLFYQVRSFCEAHPGEIVILGLYDFTSVWGQSFNTNDGKELVKAMEACFGNLLIPHPAAGKGIPTYKACIDAGQRVLILMADHASGNKVWKMSDWYRERFSEKGYINWEWSEMVDETVKDQRHYMLAGTKDGRDDSRFWNSQAVLGYNNMSEPDGHSQNWTGSKKLNPAMFDEYKKWWKGTLHTKKPNIMIMDYAGVHGDFVQVCLDLLNGK